VRQNGAGCFRRAHLPGNKTWFAQAVTEIARWTHVRRKCVDQRKASGNKVAEEASTRIALLYRMPGSLPRRLCHGGTEGLDQPESPPGSAGVAVAV
jgi:hypothetical protein